jgi:hypothetical protein
MEQGNVSFVYYCYRHDAPSGAMATFYIYPGCTDMLLLRSKTRCLEIMPFYRHIAPTEQDSEFMNHDGYRHIALMDQYVQFMNHDVHLYIALMEHNDVS